MSTLKQLAAGMYTTLDWAQQRGQSRAYIMRTLANGLQIVLSYDAEQWRIALRREGVPPGENEIEIVRAAFAIPDAAARFDNMQTEPHPKTGRKIRYFRVELLWREQARVRYVPPAQLPCDAAASGA